jgi:tryptophanyl-tRNA synthetase
MSKSYDNTIPVLAPEKEVERLVKSIQTDSTPVEQPKDPATSTVFALYSLLADASQRRDMEDKYRRGGYGYGHAKKELAELLQSHFAAGRQARQEYDRSPDLVEDILREGGRRARAVARGVTDRARAACGLGRS